MSLVLSFLVGALIKTAFSANSQDQVTNLPGLTWTTNFNQYSGYLRLENGHNLHYWFLESQNDPSSSPVVLWLNGGPGCSSLDGLLYEHGAFHVTNNGTLYNNKYSWNLIANMLYLEAPIGVGFSYSDDDEYVMNDNTTANDNYHALLKFFEEFSEFSNNDFYVTGESYGGVYVPSLTLRILEGNKNNEGKQINLKGFAVGNGLSSYVLNDDSSVWFAYYHGLIDESTWNFGVQYCCTSPYTRQNCDFAYSNNANCTYFINLVNDVIYNGTLNWYNIYGDCINTEQGISHDKYIRTLEMLEDKRFDRQTLEILKENVPCVDSTGADIYLNQDDVRSAIHIDANFTRSWSICSGILNYTTIYSDMSDIYKQIFEYDSNVYATVYNGDCDLACNFLGDEWFLDDLGYPSLDKYREWFYENQIAGWTKDYQHISFVTVRGAGHMVPQWRPPQALKMFQAFINHERL